MRVPRSLLTFDTAESDFLALATQEVTGFWAHYARTLGCHDAGDVGGCDPMRMLRVCRKREGRARLFV